MNAFQPSRPPLDPIKERRTVSPSRPRLHLRQRSYRFMALENTAKISVNLVIMAASLSALWQLLPYHWSQQDKLREARTEVKLMEGRVNLLRTEFSRNFDPHAAKMVMQQQSYRLSPGQRRIVLINQEQTTSEKSDLSP